MFEANTDLPLSLLLLLLVSIIILVATAPLFITSHRKRNDLDKVSEFEKLKAKEAMHKSQIIIENTWQKSKDMWAESVRMNAKAMSEKSKNVRKFRRH